MAYSREDIVAMAYLSIIGVIFFVGGIAIYESLGSQIGLSIALIGGLVVFVAFLSEFVWRDQ